MPWRTLKTLADAGIRDAEQLLARAYIVVTRMLIKLDATGLGLVAARRATACVDGIRNPVLAGEAARNLSVLTRKAGRHHEAAEIALNAASDLRGGSGPFVEAQRGLLVMSAGYTVAKLRDKAGMRDLTREAFTVADQLGDGVFLPSHGGGFGTPVVALHLISGYGACGDPAAALKVAGRVQVRALPTVERRARYWTDVAVAYGLWGRRGRCVEALLEAERLAPEETRSRPAVQRLVVELMAQGRTTRELRGLVSRTGAAASR